MSADLQRTLKGTEPCKSLCTSVSLFLAHARARSLSLSLSLSVSPLSPPSLCPSLPLSLSHTLPDSLWRERAGQRGPHMRTPDDLIVRGASVREAALLGSKPDGRGRRQCQSSGTHRCGAKELPRRKREERRPTAADRRQERDPTLNRPTRGPTTGQADHAKDTGETEVGARSRGGRGRRGRG